MTDRRIKIPILAFSLLLMGIIGISGGLSVIGRHFGHLPQTTIQLLFTFPCIIVIPATLLVGKLQEYLSKKALVVLGILLFLIGGVVPAFADSFPLIFILRGLLGFGVGMMQPLATALITQYFSGAARATAMGQQTAAQMLGCAAMVLLGGFLADASWRFVFYTHLVALIPLVLVLVWLPREAVAHRGSAPVGDVRQNKAGDDAPKGKVRLTRALFAWAGITFLFYVGGQVFSSFIAFFVAAHGLGTAAEAGQTVTFFALGGLLAGIVYGRFSRLTKRQTLSTGFLLCAISFFGMAFSPNIYLIYAFSLLCGISFGVVMPSLFLEVSHSVDARSAPMAFSVVMCAQNLAMFLSPSLVTPLAGALGGEINRTAMLVAGVFLGAMAAGIALWRVARRA